MPIKDSPLKITPMIKTAAEALATEDRWPADSWGNPSFLTTFAPGYYRRAAAVVAALENTNG